MTAATPVESIRDVLAVFHDGDILAVDHDGDVLSFDVVISYLANRVQSGFSRFHVRLEGVDTLAFSPWPDLPDAGPEVIVDVTRIFAGEPEILGAEVSGGEIAVTCNQRRPGIGWCGGELRLRATAITVSDEAGRSWSREALIALADGYWEEWARRNAAPA